jgi:hypothetical protein
MCGIYCLAPLFLVLSLFTSSSFERGCAFKKKKEYIRPEFLVLSLLKV